ncbi:hypothetical protein BpHYR1_009941 [Brachionus plicatilis]|uniref:Uncharacterized protein n=1 Tax=Brachionus plicatilis TaxID=10195 RepID=A0A3M7RSW0_BRAPC|nr:hypothetical protein BpHYR1_009941 [Brachionus plicatilis]
MRIWRFFHYKYLKADYIFMPSVIYQIVENKKFYKSFIDINAKDICSKEKKSSDRINLSKPTEEKKEFLLIFGFSELTAFKIVLIRKIF